MSEVELLCDDLAIINKGKIVYQNSFETFKADNPHQSLTERFIEIVKNS
jgi:sodium transport system ATP-binding protein